MKLSISSSRHSLLRVAAAWIGIAIAATSSAQVAGPFDPDVNGTVATVVTQADGKILVGGAFTQVGGTVRNRIARFTADGLLDPDFEAIDVDGSVQAILVQVDGRI